MRYMYKTKADKLKWSARDSSYAISPLLEALLLSVAENKIYPHDNKKYNQIISL